MKLNRPAKLTTRPAIMLDNTRRKNLVSGTFNPKERAESSPNESILSGLARMKDTSTAAIIPIAGSAILLNVSPDKVPIRKEVILMVISVFINLIVLIPALRKEDTVIPASIMVVRELSAIYASAYMASVVKSAPTNEAIDVAYPE